jgi:hypothetical protein
MSILAIEATRCKHANSFLHLMPWVAGTSVLDLSAHAKMFCFGRARTDYVRVLPLPSGSVDTRPGR